MQDVFEPTANFGGEVFEPMNFEGDYSNFAVENCGCKAKHPFDKSKRNDCINQCNQKKSEKKGTQISNEAIINAVNKANEEISQKNELDILRKKNAELTLDVDKKAGGAEEKISEQISASSDKAISDAKFLGMPRKLGIGVTIGVGVLALGTILFFVLKRK